MRKISQSPNREELVRFRAFLKRSHIDCEVRPLANEYSLWVFDEKDLEKAQEEWSIFLQNKEESRYKEALAAEIREEQKVALKQMAEGIIAKPKKLASKQGNHLTTTLIYISTGLWLLSLLGISRPILSNLLISEYISPRFLEIKDGQIWRLITPIFIASSPESVGEFRLS